MIDLPYLDAYIKRLQAHDWHYERSDDPRVFKAGQAARFALEREAAGDRSGVLGELYIALSNYRLSSHREVRCHLTVDEFFELMRRRLDASAKPLPNAPQQLAKMVHTLAVALARADPDNRAPQRALDALQRMGMLEAALTTPPKDTP